MTHQKLILSAAISLLPIFSGCGGIPKDALQMSQTTLEDRQLQTRSYETNEAEKILVACSGLMQDLGFNLDESETKLGLLVGSKDRTAADAAKVTAAVMWTIMFGGPCRYDENQKIKLSIVVSSAGENLEKTNVRVTFQRIVWDNYGQITKLERLSEPEMYQGFFEKLSKAIFLEAQQI